MSSLTIEQLKQRKKEAEARILEFIEHECGKFTHDTGLSIERIYVDIVDTTSHGDEYRQYAVRKVDVTPSFETT